LRDPRSEGLSLVSASPAETTAIAAACGRLAEAGDVVALDGDLGAGKTWFVAGFCAALGVPAGEVDSPSFVLVNEYAGRLPVLHLDAYRLEGDPEELLEAGFLDERQNNSVCIIEWGDRLGPLLPPTALRIRLSVTGETTRALAVSGASAALREALAPWVRP
jgi:tRNA threonylcarbamoyladenosine biosynthesis protein TsaE